LIKLYDNEKKNEKEICRIKEEVDFDLEKICYVNKFYKQINEALIGINEIENKVDEFYTERIYYNDQDNPEI
jgi:uncharacterized membrane protein YjjP (DUF1212 family)